MTDQPRVRIHQRYDRAVLIYVDGDMVASANYDDHGWSGLDLAEKITEAVAKAGGLTVEHTEGPDDGD